jgi:hypothetical protein
MKIKITLTDEEKVQAVMNYIIDMKLVSEEYELIESYPALGEFTFTNEVEGEGHD